MLKEKAFSPWTRYYSLLDKESTPKTLVCKRCISNDARQTLRLLMFAFHPFNGKPLKGKEGGRSHMPKSVHVNNRPVYSS